MSNEEEKKTESKWKVVGFNILGLLVYTLLCRLVDGGIVIDCALVGLHVFVALILALVLKKWEWFFGAVLVLIIGFSTCVTFLGNTLNMH